MSPPNSTCKAYDRASRKGAVREFWSARTVRTWARACFAFGSCPAPELKCFRGDYRAIRPAGPVIYLSWGVCMNCNKCLMLFVALAAVSLTSCSGLKSGGGICTTNCPSGNAKVSVTMFDTPPTGVTLLSFSLPIVGISLTPTTGSDVSIYSPATVVPTEVTRLQTDSAAIVTGVSVAAGTYTSINITISAPSGIFINTSGSLIGACANGLVCGLPNGAATTVKVPISLTLTSGQNQWIGLNVKLNNAIVTTGGISIDFTQANVFSATTTTRTANRAPRPSCP